MDSPITTAGSKSRLPLSKRPDVLDIDLSAQRTVFRVMAWIVVLLLPLYAVAFIRVGQWFYVALLALATATAFGCLVVAQLRDTYAWPLRITTGVVGVILSYVTLMQGSSLPAAGWWLSILPFLLAAGGLHHMAIGMVVGFLAVVTYMQLGGPLPDNAATETVGAMRRYAAVAGSEMLALMLIIISMRRQSQVAKALERARTDALESDAIKARFLANMSHEIRTPLTGIIGVADVLQSPGLSDTQRRQLVELQRHSASTLLALVNDILDISKLEAHKLTLETLPLDIRQIVFEANELFSLAAFAKGIELSSSCNPNVPRALFGDGVRIRQVVNNLVGNAVKFTGKGGVHIHVELELIGANARESKDTRRWIRIEIVDSGPGIPEESLKLLFRPFIQADETVTRQFGGTGLGLSIAAELAKLMGGGIEAHSVVGEGTTFVVRLPMELGAPEAIESAPRARPDVVIAVNTRGLERHIKTILHELRVDPIVLRRLPTADELSGCKLLLVDAPLLDAVQAGAWLAMQAARGTHVGILTPLGADSIAGGLPTAQLIFKPVTQRALELLLQDDAQADLASRVTDGGRPNPLHGLRVLVADDNPVNQIVVQAMLAELGVTATVVSNGAQALESLAGDVFDLVLMDVNMPQMDGLAATRELRAREQSQGQPRRRVLAMTAAVEGEDGPSCTAAGMDGFLAKPFSLTQLQSALQQSVAAHSA